MDSREVKNVTPANIGDTVLQLKRVRFPLATQTLLCSLVVVFTYISGKTSEGAISTSVCIIENVYVKLW